jgi:aryl-alcohol dehydrogenase-like predicted oxidoreductase
MKQGMVFPIPGTTKVANLEENLDAFNVELSDEEAAEMRKIVEEAEVHGERYPEGFTAELFRDTPLLK